MRIVSRPYREESALIAELELLVMRHAKARPGELGLSDLDRPLNARGRQAAARMGQLLAEEGLEPDAVLSSPSKRTLETAAHALAAAGFDIEVTVDEGLYNAAVGDVLHAVAGLPRAARRALVVGHNPTSEDTVSALTGRDMRMPTGAVAVIRLEARAWPSFADAARHRACELVDLWTPRSLL